VTVEITPPHPSQNPIPKRRNEHFVDGLLTGRGWPGEGGITYHGAERLRDRGYTPGQVYQTAAYGHEYADPKGRDGISIFKLNSIDTPGTRRRIVVDRKDGSLITALPREPIPEPSSKPAQRPSNTKKRKKEQLAKKRARSAGQS
jgi:hypothetical protein